VLSIKVRVCSSVTGNGVNRQVAKESLRHLYTTNQAKQFGFCKTVVVLQHPQEYELKKLNMQIYLQLSFKLYIFSHSSSSSQNCEMLTEYTKQTDWTLQLIEELALGILSPF
jgi:hypothetical protein